MIVITNIEYSYQEESDRNIPPTYYRVDRTTKDEKTGMPIFASEEIPIQYFRYMLPGGKTIQLGMTKEVAEVLSIPYEAQQNTLRQLTEARKEFSKLQSEYISISRREAYNSNIIYNFDILPFWKKLWFVLTNKKLEDRNICLK